MLSDLQLCQYCIDLYNGGDNFDDLLWPESDNGICWGMKRYGDDDLIVFRGSVTAQDWFRDFIALPHPVANHPKFGDMHAGFIDGMSDAISHIRPLVRDASRVYVTGHSLGAARATIACGMLMDAGVLPGRIIRVVFGEPRAGCQEFKDYLRPLCRSASWKNIGNDGHDEVYDVPPDPPFKHPVTAGPLFVTPEPDDPWLALRYHHIELYLQGLQPHVA